MAIPVRFEKATAQKFLAAVMNGQPFERDPASNGWPNSDLLHIAAVCLSTLIQNKPVLGTKDTSSLHPEHAELVRSQFRQDMQACIEWFAYLTLSVEIGDYDARYEPVIDVTISKTETEGIKVDRHRGFKTEGL